MPTVANQILADSASSVRIACHNKAGLAYSLPEAYKQSIGATPHVVAAVPESWFGGIYHEVSDEFPNLAVDPELIDAMWPDWGISSEATAHFKRLRTASLVGASTMKRFNWHVGQQNYAARHPVSVQCYAHYRWHHERQGAAELLDFPPRLPE